MCLEGLAGKDPVKMPCGHVICLNCVTHWIERERTCPLCKQDVPDDFKLLSTKSVRYNAATVFQQCNTLSKENPSSSHKKTKQEENKMKENLGESNNYHYKSI